MKRTLIYAIFIAMTALISATASAQPDGHREDWKKKMMSERVAFFTVELDLTPEEAQAFWPVYNQIEKEKDEANANVFMTFIELEKAIQTKKPEKEISDLLDKHMDAIEKQNEITSKADEKYRKVLPVAKVPHGCLGDAQERRRLGNTQADRARIRGVDLFRRPLQDSG